jgi:Tfp pilus assembly protein PilW
MMSRLRDESGLTLVELLAATLIGAIVTVGSFSMLDAASRSSRQTSDRVDAVARGRAAMEDMARQIRSQMCVGTTPPVVEATSTRVVFTGNLLTTDPATSTIPVQRRTLEYTPNGVGATRGRIVETVVDGVGSPPLFNGPAKTRTIIADVAPVSGKVFRYWTFDTANIPNTVELTAVPLTQANRRIVSHVQVQFDAMPTSAGANSRLKTLFDTTIYVRSSDPTAPSPGPRCT